jgi:hypothetical protein
MQLDLAAHTENVRLKVYIGRLLPLLILHLPEQVYQRTRSSLRWVGFDLWFDVDEDGNYVDRSQ